MFLTILSIVAVVAFMIFFNALYVAAEFATVSSRRTRVSQLAGQGNRMAQLLLPIMQDSKKLDTYVATCQIGITISSLVVGAYGQSVIAQLLVGPFANLLTALEPTLASIGIESTAGWAEPPTSTTPKAPTWPMSSRKSGVVFASTFCTPPTMPRGARPARLA